MNKKGLVGPIGAIFLFLLFIVLWLVFLAEWLNNIGQMIITTNSLTGLEAFFYSNLNLTVFICMILGMLGFMCFGSE